MTGGCQCWRSSALTAESNRRNAPDIEEKQALRESGETALVQPGLNIAVPDTLQVDHGRSDIAVPHPLLKRADVDSILQVPGRVGMAEFVQKPTAAKGAICAAVDLDCPIFEFVRGDAMTAIQPAAPRHGFELFEHGAVRPS